jgi:hypothetical protein
MTFEHQQRALARDRIIAMLNSKHEIDERVDQSTYVATYARWVADSVALLLRLELERQNANR